MGGEEVGLASVGNDTPLTTWARRPGYHFFVVFVLFWRSVTDGERATSTYIYIITCAGWTTFTPL